MKHLDLFSGIGGFAIAMKKIFGRDYENIGHSEIDTDACKVYHHNFEESQCLSDIQKISFSQQDSPVKMLPSLEIGKDLKEVKQDSSESWRELLGKLHQNDLSSKMFPDFSLSTKGKTSTKSLPRYSNSGIAWCGSYLMLNTTEWHSKGDVCGLSEVLETQVPSKYYLSKKAVEGMIRRSKKGGKGGYVFLQETVNETIQMKLLSLTQLEQLTSRETSKLVAETLSPQRSEQTTTIQRQQAQNQTISLPTQSTQDKEVSLAGYGKTLILRKLTPLEKDRLMGYPEGWTTIMGNDAKRGKGLGNAIVPQCAEVIMQRIKQIHEPLT